MSDPSAHEIIGIYRRHAEAFASQRGSARLIEEPWLERFASGLRPGAQLLDIGCGMGRPIGEWLLGRGFRLTGIDASAPLLARAREALPEAEWIEADMRAIPELAPFDGLIAWHSFFHLSPADQRAMFPQFGRMAGPKARLMFTSGPAAGEAFGSFEGERLYHASLDPEEYRALLADEGFGVIAQRSDDPGCGGATVWLAERG